ncbi:MAG: glycosyltransferase family 4 protein [Mammaliicoccus vitulinus]
MKVLLWAPFGAGTHYWGPGTSAYRLYKNNKDKDIKVTLVHGSKCQDKFPEVYDKQIKIGNIDDKALFNYLLYLIKSYKWIRAHRDEYDVFHGISAFFYTFFPAIFFRNYNKPTFIKISGIQGGFSNNGRISRLTGFKKFRLKNANKLSGYISISTHITSSLKDNGVDSKRIFHIPNGVDTTRFYPINENKKKKLRHENGLKNIFTLVYIGGLTRNKNVNETVKAVSELVKKGYDLQFLIVGPDRSGGIIEEELENYINEHHLQDICLRVEHSTQPEIYFQMADVFILNSKFEGLSNSLLEAMATGLPCIAYPASGSFDLIEDKVNGFFTDGSSVQIAEKLIHLYENKNLYLNMATKAREKIEKQYSVAYVLQQHFELFRNGIKDNVNK